MNRTTHLRVLRVKRAMSQEALEAASGVSQTIISKIERVGPSLGVAHAIALAKALGTTVEELFAADAEARRASTPVRARARELRETHTPRRRGGNAAPAPTGSNG